VPIPPDDVNHPQAAVAILAKRRGDFGRSKAIGVENALDRAEDPGIGCKVLTVTEAVVCDKGPSWQKDETITAIGGVPRQAAVSTSAGSWSGRGSCDQPIIRTSSIPKRSMAVVATEGASSAPRQPHRLIRRRSRDDAASLTDGKVLEMVLSAGAKGGAKNASDA
jgi:hypothetical protein